MFPYLEPAELGVMIRCKPHGKLGRRVIFRQQLNSVGRVQERRGPVNHAVISHLERQQHLALKLSHAAAGHPAKSPTMQDARHAAACVERVGVAQRYVRREQSQLQRRHGRRRKGAVVLQSHGARCSTARHSRLRQLP